MSENPGTQAGQNSPRTTSTPNSTPNPPLPQPTPPASQTPTTPPVIPSSPPTPTPPITTAAATSSSPTTTSTSNQNTFLCIICAEKKGLKLKQGEYFPGLCSVCGEVHTGGKANDYQR